MILIPENNIDLHIRRAVKYASDSDTGLKFACIAASPVVGSYDGTTQEIAKRTNRSVSTVENWAHAHWLYKELRAGVHRKMARHLWRVLPASHWWKAYDIQQAGYDSLYYLSAAHQYGWSGRGMMAEFDKELKAGHAPLILKRAKIAIRGLASEMLKQSEKLTESQRVALLSVMDSFKEDK